MNKFSDKIKIIYLSIVIIFSLFFIAYLMDSWGMIRLQNYLPFLKNEPPVVDVMEDSETEIALEKLRKEQEKLKDEEIRLQEIADHQTEEKKDIEEKLAEIKEMQKGLEEQKAAIEKEKSSENNRSKKIKDMAKRIYSMPPDDSVAIVAGWSNSDLVDVFIQMEKDAASEGRQSIVPYLMTKMPRDRAAVITSLMLDEHSTSGGGMN